MIKPKLELALMKFIAKGYKVKLLRSTKYAVCYTRVSTLEQAMNNGSLDTQIKLNKEYAQRNGLIIVEFFGGKYDSAKTDGRQEFQRMLDFVKKNKHITYIIVSNYDRFSRSGGGAIKLSEDLRDKHGIILKSVTQDFDTSTATGRLQENLMHLLNNFDNVMKSDRTKLHTKEVMEKGFWPYATPLGYENLKKKQRACFHQYVITEEGKLLKQAFYLKAEGKLSNREIIATLQTKGVRINEKTFRQIISNPFYAGYVTGKLLEGKLVKGKHPALIDLQVFLKANEMLNQSPIAGRAKVFRHEEVPLKLFAKDEISGQPFTGYVTKGNWYYKTKVAATPVNIKAEKLNTLFVKYLSQFEYRSDKKESLKKALISKIKERLSTSIEDAKQTKKKLAEKVKELDMVENKFLLDKIDETIYKKHTARIKEEIRVLTEELGKTEISSSNLEKAVEQCLSIAQNISSTWVTADFENKRMLQHLVFPKGVVYNKENHQVRTDEVNSLFQAIPYLKRITEENKKGNLEKDCLNSVNVPRTGIEPAHHC